jgi:hypothetical protein
VKETRAQIRTLESASPGDGDDSSEESSSGGSDDDGDGSHRPSKRAGKVSKPLGEDLEVVLNVNVYSSGKLESTRAQPLLLLVQECS